MDPRTEKMLTEHAQKTAAIPPVLRGPVRVANDWRIWAKTHAAMARVGAVAFAAALLAAYYVFVTMPADRLDRIQMKARSAEQIRVDMAARQVAVDECLSKAQAEADARWAAACKARREGARCALPWRQTGELERAAGEARNSCLTRYSLAAQ